MLTTFLLETLVTDLPKPGTYTDNLQNLILSNEIAFVSWCSLELQSEPPCMIGYNPGTQIASTDCFGNIQGERCNHLPFTRKDL